LIWLRVDLWSIKVRAFVCDPNVFKNICQAVHFIFIVCKKPVLPVDLHFAGSEQLGLFNLSATELYLVSWLTLTHLSLQAVVILLLRSDATALRLTNLLLRLCSGLLNSRSVLLGDFALHHVDTAAFQLLANVFLFALPLGLLSAALNHVWLGFLTLNSWDSFHLCRLLLLDWSFVYQIKGIVQNFKILELFTNRFF
jgi:hypothetical protein